MTTAIIDYGVGNLFSLKGALDILGIDNVITADPKRIADADKLILPGVGAFGAAANKLRDTGLEDIISNQVKLGKPLLGICLGMQLLFESSSEYGEHKGLGFIPGRVKEISPDLTRPLKVPHMGWNALIFKKHSRLFKYVSVGDYVYFVHSFYACDCAAYTTAVADYSTDITAAVENGNVYGTQFHPEKSGKVGLGIIKAFGEIK